MEIYESLKGKKKKFVVAKADADYIEVVNYCKKLFKCSEFHITVEPGYIYEGLLYLEDPMKYGVKKVTVAYYIR